MMDKCFQADNTINIPEPKISTNSGEKMGHFNKKALSKVMENRKYAEEKLHFQARLLDVIEQAVLAINLEGTIVYWNPYAVELFGWSAEEVKGQNIANLGNPPSSRIKQIEYILERIKRGKSWVGNVEVYTRSGNLFPIRITCSPLYDEAGRITGIVGVASDATDRKQAEEALLLSEKKYSSLINSVKEVIFQTDATGLWTFLNPAWTEITGYSVEESLNTYFLDYVYEADRDYYNDLFQPKIIDRRKPHYAQEIRCQTKAGEIRWLEVYSRYILDENRNIIGTSGFFNDITERKQAELKLQKMQDELRQSQKMEAIGRLAGGVAHDFSNLLTVIACCTEIITEKLSKDDPLYDIAQEIQGSAERAVALTRQLLLFSRQQVPETIPVDLNFTLENMVKLLKRLLNDDINLIIQTQPNLRKVRADTVQLEQVIMNLVINARDAMPYGGKLLIKTTDVTLDANYTVSPSELIPGPYVLLSISDSGTGMSEEVKSHIFEPYFTTKAPTKGTGLGLSSVYAIVKQSGGHIRVDSERGLGTNFKIYLPAAIGETELDGQSLIQEPSVGANFRSTEGQAMFE